MNFKTYSQLIRFRTFEERFDYLVLTGVIGESTFGFDRVFNQAFYRGREWLNVRDHVILRDNGCDLGIEDREIRGRIIVHHMNPIFLKDLETHSDFLLNPEYLISTSHNTHTAITYGNKEILPKPFIERSKFDTIPWKH